MKLKLVSHEIRCGYAAGMFDGEGCVNISVLRSGATQLSVSITNTDRRALDEIQSIWGGSVKPVKDERKNNKLCYVLRFKSGENEEFLIDIIDYTIIKTDQIGIALEYFELMRTPNKYVGLTNGKGRVTRPEIRMQELGFRDTLSSMKN